MAEWVVTLPFAGHLVVSVDASSKDEAIEKAFNKATLHDVEDWEALDKFNQGNVCYCPSPWEAEAEQMEEEEEAA